MKYKITYNNGVTQELEMIPKVEFDNFRKAEIEGFLTERQIYLKQLFKEGKGVVDDSPIGKAILGDGVLILPDSQGGKSKIEVEALKN